MKISITLKDPDALIEAVRSEVTRGVSNISGLSPDERVMIIDQRCDDAYAILDKWFRYGEYVDIEVDTDAGTCVVKEQK